jgi:hypothetical protein
MPFELYVRRKVTSPMYQDCDLEFHPEAQDEFISAAQFYERQTRPLRLGRDVSAGSISG